MKYSDYVKNEMNTLPEDIVMEAAASKADGKDKNASKSSAILIRGTKMDTIRNIASVAACAVLAVAVAMAFILLPGSIPTQDTMPADTGTEEPFELVEVPVWVREQRSHEAELAVDILTSKDGDYNYYAIDGEATVVRYLGDAEELTVPTEIDGCEVVKVEGYFLDEGVISRTELANDDTDKNFGFIYGTGVTDVTVPGTVEVGHMAFANCQYLMKLILCEGVERFEGMYTFYECISLRSIEFPLSFKEFGKSNTSGVISLEYLYYLGTEEQWREITKDEWGLVRDTPVVFGIHTPEYYISEDGKFEYYIENDTAVIVHYLGVENKLTVPEMVDDMYVVRIEGYPVTKEEGVVTGGSVHGIIYGSNVTEVVVPGTIQVGENAFRVCQNLRKLTLEDGITKLGNGMANNCINLKEVNLPDTLEVIDISAFNNNDSLTKIVIPDSVTSIGIGAFDGCKSLVDVTLSKSLRKIDNSVFYLCESLREITIPDSVVKIDQMAFAHCYALESVTFGKNLEAIDMAAFWKCYSLDNVVFPESLNVIEEGAFSDCESLENVNFLAEGVRVKFDAFKDSPVEDSYFAPKKPRNIAEVEIEFDESIIPDDADFAFEGSSKIKTSEDGNYNYVIRDEGLIIVKYLGDETSVVIPTEIDGVKVYGTQGYMIIEHAERHENGTTHSGSVRGIFFESKVESVLIPTTIEVGHETFATYEPDNVSYYTPEE